MFQDSILAFYQFLKNENRAKNAQRIFYSPRSILILLIFVSSMITLSSGSPVTPDDKWRIVFDSGIDAPFNYSTSFAPKVWLYNQGGSLDSTASITYTYFDVNGNLQIATGTATNNGDGSYTGAALNMPYYADKYINVLFSVSAGSNTLREQHVFYAGQSNGAHGALWKIEVFNTSAGPSWNGNNQQKIYMKLYSDAGTLYRNNLNTPTIVIWNSGGTSLLSATAMTYEEDGVYSYNISGYANGDYYFQIYNQWSSRQVTGGNTRNTKAYAGLYLEANNTQGDESLPQIDSVERKPYFPVDDDYVNITAHVLDNINITSANLYYTVNNQTVQTEPLIKQTDFEYRATLDPYLLEDNIRYRVEVNDGTNTASSTWYLYNVQDHRGSQNMSHSFLSHPVYWFGYSRQADLSVADRGGDTNYDGVYSTGEKDGVAYLSVTQSYPYFKDMTRIKVQSLIMDETGKPIQHLKNVTAWLSNNKTQSAGTHNQEKTMTEVAGESGVYTAAWEGSPDVPNATYVWNEEAKAIWGQYISGEVYSVYIDINNDGQLEENVTWLAYNVGDTFWGSSENGKNFNDHLNLEQGGSCSRSRCHNSMSGTSRVNGEPSCPDCHGVYRNANGGVWPVEKGSAVSEDTILYGNSTGHPRQDIKNATTCGDETCHNVAWGTSPSATSSVEIPGYPAGTRLNATFRADYPNPMQCGEHHNFKAGKIPVQEGHNKMVACKYCHGGNHDNSKLIKYNISIMSTNLSNVNRGTPGYVGTGGVNGSGTYAGNCYKDCHRVQVDHSLTGMPGGATENKAVPCDECHQNFNNAPMHQENVFPYSDRESCAGCHQQQGNITPHNASITLSPPRIPATLLHAKETGTNWNNTGTRPYWVENENSCRFCHGRSYNEAYGLGRIRNFMGTNIINDNIVTTSYWCASCHVDNGSETHYNYSAMAIIYNYSFGVVPPEITNSTWKSDRSGYQDHNALGFVNKLDSGTYSDRQCFNCHAGNNSLDAGLDAWQHSLPGKPKHTLSGYVTSISSGSPLSGVAVQAKSTIPNATTDANGFYRFTALSDETYIVNASLAGYISNSTIITVSGADVANANISLSPVPPAPTYIPPAPSNLTSTQGNFWVNYTWQAGEGNVTDSYSVNVNGIWINGTAMTYYNSTVGAHNWSNITIWAYNSSGSGQLGLTPASNAAQVANNNPVQAQIGTRIITAGNVLSFTVSATDADSDPITYGSNNSKGTFNTTTGAYSWTTTVDDVGNYTWSFNSSDNYGGAAVETITVTVTSMLTYAVSGYVFDNNGAGLGGVLVQNGSFQDTTMASGYYSTTGLLNGTYNFSYSKPGFNTGYLVVTVSGVDVTNANKTILNTAAAASVTDPAATTGNFFINNTWVNPGDPDFNYTWFRYNNGTTLQNVSAPANYLNLTSLQHYIQNISAQTVDTYGNVNQTRVWFNATIPNNLPMQSPIGNKIVSEGNMLTFTVSATDADSDAIIYRTNATKGTLDPATGVYSWTLGYTDAGNYVWEFNSSDNFSGVDNEVITVTVINAPLTIISSAPVSDPITIVGTAPTFVTDLNRTATVTWYINGSVVQTNSSVATASYTNYTAGIGSYNVTASATDGIDSVSRKWNWTVSAIPTYQVSGYVFDNYGVGLGGVLVKNGSYQNTTLTSGYYLITGVPNGTYNFNYSKPGFNTGYLMVTVSGADNKTANKTIYDTTPPASIDNLMNTSYAPTYINWTWNDPDDADFEKVMIYLDGIFQINVSKGVQYYNATNLTSGTVYTLGTSTMDKLGNINATTVSNTAATRQAITGVCIDCHPAVNVYLFGRHANVNTTDGGTTDADCKTCHRGAANGTMSMMPGAADHSNTYFCEDCHTSTGPGPIKPNDPALIKDELRHGSTNCQWCHIAGDQLPKPLDNSLKYHAIGPKGTATGNTCKSCHVDANLPDLPFHAPGETHATSASCIGGCHESNNHIVTYIDQPSIPPVLENIIITSPVSTGNFAQVQTTLRDTQSFLQMAAAQYQVKDASGNTVIDWTNMTPKDGRLNSYTEIVNASINTSNLLGTYTVYIKGMSSAPKTNIYLPYYPFNGLWSGAASRTLNVTQPTGYVNGTVRNGSGSNLSGATVTTNTGVSNITDANGSYSLSLVTGTYQLAISKEPEYYINSSVTVTVTSSTIRNIILGIKPTGNIVGAVRNT
ncbi:hypothetical protein METP2_02118 [Methanosarcinales archaeon]|nr:hypothetical protein METP2_02118 [Methanosarcinales archaeon]